MTFADQINAFVKKVHGRERALYRAVVEHAAQSVLVGSEITGAPGQPVDTGRLLNSWRLKVVGSRQAALNTDAPYADDIENNPGNRQYRNHGPHSIKLTRAAWPRIVQYELNKMGVDSVGGGSDVPRLRVQQLQRRDSRGRFAGAKPASLGFRG